LQSRFLTKKATLYAIGTKLAGTWTFSKLAVQVDGGELIDLNESGGESESSEKEE
jgi:hypothetical protein